MNLGRWLCLLMVLTCSHAYASPGNAPISTKIIGQFDLAKPERVRFGKLVFLSGLVLKSSNRHFGGLSALRIFDNDKVLAVTDTGFWFSAKLMHDDEGNVSGFGNGRLSPILNSEGDPFISKWAVDAEGLAVRQNSVFVSAEQDGRILGFDTSGELFTAPSNVIVNEFPGGRLRGSYGLEALAVIPENNAHGGALLAISEHSLDENGDLRAFIVSGKDILSLSVKSLDGYSVTDADFLPDGDLLILERRFSLGSGPQARIRQIDRDAIKPGALLNGDVIFEANRHQQIDNMEGISVFEGKDGSVRIALVSDDNHWLLQRTLYLEFLYDPSF